MMTRMCRGVLLAGLAIGAVVWSQAALGEQFRIRNKVFAGGGQDPQVQTTTMFMDDMVYDFLEAPPEVTVFDKAGGRFVLLDLGRRVKTELSTERVAALATRLQQWARMQSDPYLRFLASPKFDETFDEHTGELTLSSAWLTYRASSVPARSEAAMRQYREFADWYCRLNTTINPGSRPPFARLELNAALARHGRLAREVVLTLRPKAGPVTKRITIRSEHEVTDGLKATDRSRIAQVEQFMAMFKPVSFEQYQAKIAD